jgi:dihydrolipoamide dehydrogenase
MGELRTQVVVLGSGPGGYTAAFRAADLGKAVVLVERYPTLGGVCLNVGCIPSKALLHVAEVIAEVESLADHGVSYGEPKLDLARLRAHVQRVVGTLTGGLASMAKQRGVRVVTGTGRFTDPRRLAVEGAEAASEIAFEHAVVAVGSEAMRLPGLPADDRVMDSTGALALEEIPRRLLVIGGGIIGLEMAAVYDALGAEVTIVELLPQLMTGTDPDLVRVLARRIEKRYAGIYTGTKLTSLEARADGLHAAFEGPKAPARAVFDRALVAVGRRPLGDRIGAEAAGVAVDAKGFIAVDERQRTNVPHVLAIGDVTGPPLLAHRASHQGKVAAEVIAGLPSAFDARAIPAVAYTDPEVAWMGLGEAEAKSRGLDVEVARFPWSASGRALGIGRGEGLTKLLFAKDTGRLVGAGIAGARAGDLVSECVLALEMGADAEDLALSVHPHPTLSETVAFAAEVAHGSVTDLYVPRKK